MAVRLLAIVGGVALFGACTEQSDAGLGNNDAGMAACQPVDAEEPGQCRAPLDETLCAATWDTRPAPMCGLRIYEGPGGGYLLQYVSYNDIPPVGGPSWMCVFDGGTQALVGAWALDHYPRWCCGSSFDLFQGVATDEIANLAVSMATHPPCPDAGT
jgi:hypothetical protein